MNSGPNAGVTGTATTGSNGVATFTYPGTTAGTDTLTASVTNVAGTFTSNPVTVVWNTAPTMTGEAYGLSANASALFGLQVVNVPPIPDTGQVATTTASSTPSNCLATLSGAVSGTVLCSNVTTALGPPRSTATASVATANVSIAGLPTIIARAVQAQSTTSCAGSSGSTTIAYLQVGSVVVVIPSNIPPNYTLNVLGVSLTLNEQYPVPGGLTVNAIHIRVNTLGTTADVVVSSATSDIENCPS